MLDKVYQFSKFHSPGFLIYHHPEPQLVSAVVSYLVSVVSVVYMVKPDHFDEVIS